VQREYSAIAGELVELVRDQVGAVASFRHVAIVQRLPKTRSGKILRGTMRRIADCEPDEIPATIDDPAILEEIRTALRQLGYAGA
jgi:propionyl-CoA synthetase